MPRPVDYAPRFEVVDLVQRGLTTLLACPVYRSGELAVPTQAGSTVTIYDESGTAVVSAAAVTVTDGVATYALLGSTTSSAAVTVTDGVATYSLLGSTTSALELGRGWRIEWALLMPDGIVHTFRAEAGLVRCAPSPVIADPALFARVPSLNPRGPGQPLTSRTSYQGAIDDAWIRLRNDLDQVGHRVELVVSNTALREPHLLLTLSAIFADLAARNPAHQMQADKYHEQYTAAMARAVLAVDTDDDGDGDTVRPARPPLFLM